MNAATAIRLVATREVRERLRTRGYLISTGILIVLLGVGLALQTAITALETVAVARRALGWLELPRRLAHAGLTTDEFARLVAPAHMHVRSVQPSGGVSDSTVRLVALGGTSTIDLVPEQDARLCDIEQRIRGADYRRTPSAALVGRAALVLGLPVDYWPEYRMAKVVERLGSDARLRDEIFDSLPQDVREAVPSLREDRSKGQRRPQTRRGGKRPAP